MTVKKTGASSLNWKESDSSGFEPSTHFYVAFCSLAFLALAAAFSSTSISVALTV